MTKIKSKIISIISGAGIAIMSYLTYLHYSGSASSFCDISEGVSCQVVNQSIYSEIFGIPVSILGLLYFLTVFILSLQAKSIQKYLSLIFYLSIFVIVPSLYLTYTEIFIIKSICLFCEISKVLMIVIAFLLYRIAATKEKLFRLQTIITIIILGLIVTGIVYITQTRNLSTKNYDEFAQCLMDKDATFYGAFWCSNCARQKKEFGNSFRFIEEIECDPRGENPQTERCIQRDISKTPTWIMEQNGIEVKRLPGGYQSFETLAEFFNCQLPEN